MSGERGHAFFGALKFLQEKTPIENYAIVDRSVRTKDFFENQNFVNFKKIFFYRDHVKPLHIPDIDYLQAFEKKHSLNFWHIAFADPTFYPFDDISKFTESEILSLIEDDCRFFEQVIEEIKPDFLIAHVGGQKQLNLLREISQSYGVKILRFAPARFGKRFQISKNYDILDKILGEIDTDNDEKLDDDYLQKIRENLDLYQFYHGSSPWGYNLNKVSFVLGTLSNIFTINKESKKIYSDLKNHDIMSQYFSLIWKNIQKMRRKKFLDNNSLHEIVPNEKFVYFSLHVQPEQTTSILAPYFTDQISLIRNVACSLPIDYFLYVKEHPSMGIFYHWRDVEYYKKILDMPNVRLIHPSVNSSLLFEHCSLVITITGSASYEASMYRKPVLVFADVSNMDLPSVTRVKNMEELPQIIRKVLGSQFDEHGCKNFFESKMKESIAVNFSLFNDILNTFFIKNTNVDDITNQKMSSFIKRNEKELLVIADEFLRKIHQYENNKIVS